MSTLVIKRGGSWKRWYEKEVGEAEERQEQYDNKIQVSSAHKPNGAKTMCNEKRLKENYA